MSAVQVLKFPLSVDLAGFVGLLRRLNVPHRVSEESGQQVLWVPDERLAEQVRELYRRYPEGDPQATLEAARLRLRPIVMTSLAFGFGVVPLALSSGAGSGAQVAIGTGVLGGIVTATVLAVFLVPLFFLVVGRLFRLRKAPRTGNSPQIPTEQA